MPADGLSAFTPEGERAWVGPTWNPRYPAADPTFAVGLVFLAAGAIWVVTDVEVDRVRYARVTPQEKAGTVEVRRLSEGVVEVTYDLTALRADAEGELADFAHRFDAMLAEWALLLEAADASRRSGPAGG